jgi:predicted small secreted protein
LKKFLSIIALIISVILISGCIGDESVNESKAINTTQNYGEGNFTILYLTSIALNMSGIGNDINVTGWSASKLEDNVYNVTFAYTENGEPQIIEFRTNINTGNVTGVNKIAQDLVESIDIVNQ